MKRGILATLKNTIQRHRIGEILVSKGYISPSQLRSAMKLHNETQRPLGEIFVERNFLSKAQLSRVLVRQSILRACTAFILCFAAFGATDRKARADMAPGYQLASVSASSEFQRVAAYPKFYGTTEKRSGDLKAFTKWTGMFKRFDRQLKDERTAASLREWQKGLRGLQSANLKDMARGVNDLVNEKRYIVDSKNWGKSDYWATPAEFLSRGGDCEDFAIMKYAALRSMGVPEERLRLAIVQDTKKNIPHAVLVVYTDEGAYLLDNQIKRLISAEGGAARYRPIYSINRQAWWLHSEPSTGTRIASAN